MVNRHREHLFPHARRVRDVREQPVDVHRECLELGVTAQFVPMLAGHELKVATAIHVKIVRTAVANQGVEVAEIAQRRQLAQLMIRRSQGPFDGAELRSVSRDAITQATAKNSCNGPAHRIGTVADPLLPPARR